MGFLLQVLTLIAVLVLLGFQAFQYLHGEKITKIPQKVVYKPVYTLTLEGDVQFAKNLLERGYPISYSDGKVFISVSDPKEAEKLLTLYGNYTKNLTLREAVSFALSKLIEEDIEQTKKGLEKTLADYGELKAILSSRGVNPEFTLFTEDILELQRELYNQTLLYWDRKFDQLLKGFKEPVKEPSVDTANLLRRAAALYGNDLKFRLFKLYLQIKLEESRLAADLIKYREYGGPR